MVAVTLPSSFQEPCLLLHQLYAACLMTTMTGMVAVFAGLAPDDFLFVILSFPLPIIMLILTMDGF